MNLRLVWDKLKYKTKQNKTRPTNQTNKRYTKASNNITKRIPSKTEIPGFRWSPVCPRGSPWFLWIYASCPLFPPCRYNNGNRQDSQRLTPAKPVSLTLSPCQWWHLPSWGNWLPGYGSTTPELLNTLDNSDSITWLLWVILSLHYLWNFPLIGLNCLTCLSGLSSLGHKLVFDY